MCIHEDNIPHREHPPFEDSTWESYETFCQAGGVGGWKVLRRARASGHTLCSYMEGSEELEPCLAFHLRGGLPDPYYATGDRVSAVTRNNFHHLARCE